MKSLFITLAIFTLHQISAHAGSVDLSSKDTRTQQQKDFDRTQREVKAEYDRQQAEKTREVMRDKTHDNRVKVGKDTSIGGSANPAGVNIRTTTP